MDRKLGTRTYVGRNAAVLLGVGLLLTSCQAEEQGYWTKHGVSQALTNEQYPADSERCERLAEQDEGSVSQTARATRYMKCMHARGYEWVVERPMSQPAKVAGQPSEHMESCPTGRVIVDAFGYPKCVPAGKKDRGVSPEVRAEVTRDTPRVQQPSVPEPVPTPPANDQWQSADRLCRRMAQETLSSTYGIYAQCMQEKGWPHVAP